MRSLDVDPDAGDVTGDLLDRARAGDHAALNELFERHLPMLRRWTHGRLPRWARDVADTADLVQDTLLDTLKQLDRFEHRGNGALQAYLRQAVMNRIRNEFRKRAIRGVASTLDSRMPDEATSPLEAAIGQELLDEYDAALERLRPEERGRRCQPGGVRPELRGAGRRARQALADAARMAVVRALVRLAEEMHRAR